MFAFHDLYSNSTNLSSNSETVLRIFLNYLTFLKFYLLFGFMIIFISMALLKVCSCLL